MKSEENDSESEVSVSEEQKFLRTLAVIVIGVGGLPLLGAIMLLNSADPLPAGVPWLEHHLTAVLLLGAFVLHDIVGIALMVASIKPERSEKLARKIRRIIGGGPDDHMVPPP